MATPSALEQYMLELVNRARLDPSGELARHNAWAAANDPSRAMATLDDGLGPPGLGTAQRQPLAFVAILETAASGHSAWMLENDVFAHDQPNPSDSDGVVTASERIFRSGWTDEGNGWRTGENLSWAGAVGDPGYPSAPGTVLLSHHGLFHSPGHRVNILNGEFSEIGIGQEIGTFTRNGVDYLSSMITQKFADAGRTFLTGVAISDADGDAFYDVGEGLAGVSVTASGAAGTFATQTWTSGGYSLAVPDGTYTVVFSGGALGGTVSKVVTVAGANAKVDAMSAEASSPPSAPPRGAHSAQDTATIVYTFVTGSAPPDPGGLAAFVAAQVGSPGYQATPAPWLGGYEAMGLGLSETTAFQARFGQGVQSDFVRDTYVEAFGRAALKAQVDHFLAQIAYFEALYTGAGIDAAVAGIRARGAVVGQMLGYAAEENATAPGAVQAASLDTAVLGGDPSSAYLLA